MDNNQTDDPSVGDLDEMNDNDDNTIRVFQDDTVTDDSVTDPITIEAQGENDDPVKILNVPEKEYGDELRKRTFDGTSASRGDDMQSSQDGSRDIFEGTEDDLYNEQEDAADQASDKTVSQDEIS